MKLGYLAVEERSGRNLFLTRNGSPRHQLLEKLNCKHAAKMYADDKSGNPKHIGYIVRGEWFRIYEVHNWQGKA